MTTIEILREWAIITAIVTGGTIVGLLFYLFVGTSVLLLLDYLLQKGI